MENFPQFKQIAFVVEDLDAAVRDFHRNFAVGPWTAWSLGPQILKDMIYQGSAAEFSFRHALAWQNETQLELVQPVSGPSIFADHLERHGPGLHHIGAYVPDHAGAVRAVLAEGYVPLQSARGFGAEGDGAFAYFSAPGVPTVVELIQAPRVRIPPDFVYPA
jgi:hypothetical protein